MWKHKLLSRLLVIRMLKRFQTQKKDGKLYYKSIRLYHIRWITVNGLLDNAVGGTGLGFQNYTSNTSSNNGFLYIGVTIGSVKSGVFIFTIYMVLLKDYYPNTGVIKYSFSVEFDL